MVFGKAPDHHPVLLLLQNDFERSKMFWSGPNRFVFGPVKNDFDSAKINWTHPKQLVLDHNYLDGPKSFLTHRRTRH